MPADAVADPGDELVDVVDGEVRLVGPALRREVRRRKLLHRSCAVLVRDVRSQIFVHRRTDTKDVFPGLYDMFVAGVVLSGENYEGAARRELMEELGSNPDDLRPLFRHRYDGPDNAQWTQVFEATCRRPPVLQREEIAWGGFMSEADLVAKLEVWPFVPDGLEVFRRYLELRA